MAKVLLMDLKFSNSAADTIITLINSHMDHSNVKEMKASTFKKYVSRPTHDLEMELHRLDCVGSSGNFETYEHIKERKAAIPKEDVNPPALITGKDLIDAGYKPGPEFKKVLDDVRDAQLDGKIATREEALEMI